MHIILDSNVYLSDFELSGGPVESLLDYLIKTSSRLIVPTIVLDEISARYRDILTQRVDKAKRSMAALNAMLCTMTIPLPDFNVDEELSKFRANVLSPRNGIKAHLLEGYPEVTIDEVVRRGIHRIPPASKGGEQLRDVILWLVAVSYSKLSSERVVLISTDSDFRASDKSSDLHPALVEELTLLDGKLEFYPSIEAFLKAYSLKFASVPSEQFYKWISKKQITDLFNEEVIRRTTAVWHGERTAIILEYEAELLKATLYDVTPASQYCEADFTGNATVQILDWQYPPPEALFSAEAAQVIRAHRNPVSTTTNKVTASMRISLRLVGNVITDYHVESFQMNFQY